MRPVAFVITILRSAETTDYVLDPPDELLDEAAEALANILIGYVERGINNAHQDHALAEPPAQPLMLGDS